MNYIIKSDIGVVRKENQDLARVIKIKNFTLAILCDGMGGHVGGLEAATIAVNVFEKEFKKRFLFQEKEISSWFKLAVNNVRENMIKFLEKKPLFRNMGTTLSLVIISEHYLSIFNIGDSRVYVNNGVLNQITVDHNLENYYIKKFGYTKEKASKMLGASALTSALGPNKNIKYEHFKVERKDSIKSIVLTSDGIHDYIDKDFFEKVINLKDEVLDEKANSLIKEAIKNNSTDNLTVVIFEEN